MPSPSTPCTPPPRPRSSDVPSATQGKPHAASREIATLLRDRGLWRQYVDITTDTTQEVQHAESAYDDAWIGILSHFQDEASRRAASEQRCDS